jgi:hypothetical protein
VFDWQRQRRNPRNARADGMINRKLRSDLLSSLNISKQALSQRAKRVKNEYGPMTTEEAVYVIAHMTGLDLTKYLPLLSIDRVRSLVPRNASITISGNPNNRGERKPEKLQ